MDTSLIPQKLLNEIGSEPVDFTVKAGRFQPPANSMILVFIGISIAAVFSAVISPILQAPDKVAEQSVNTGMYKIFISGFFALVLLIFITAATGIFSSRSGYYVGTSSRLIHYRKDRLRSIPWDQFTGDIEIKGNDRSARLIFKLRTGTIHSGIGAGNRRFVPDVIYFSGVPDAWEIYRICRKRIRGSKG